MSLMPNRMFPPITWQELKEMICQEVKETFVAVTRTTKQFILTHGGEKNEQAQMVEKTTEKAARQLAPSIPKLFQRLAYAMTEIDYESEKGSEGHVMLAESYIWASFCCIAYMLGGVFGMSDITSAVLSPVLSQINAFVLASCILPIYGHLYSRKTLQSEGTNRTFVLYYSFIIGVLLAFVTGTVHSESPVFIFPLWIGLVTCFRASQWCWVLGWRIVYVVVATLSPLGMHIILDHYVYRNNWPSIWALAPYTLSWVEMSGLAFIDLQVKLGRLKRGWSAANIEHWNTAMVYILGQFYTYPHVVLPFGFSAKAKPFVVTFYVIFEIIHLWNDDDALTTPIIEALAPPELLESTSCQPHQTSESPSSPTSSKSLTSDCTYLDVNTEYLLVSHASTLNRPWSSPVRIRDYVGLHTPSFDLQTGGSMSFDDALSDAVMSKSDESDRNRKWRYGHE